MSESEFLIQVYECFYELGQLTRLMSDLSETGQSRCHPLMDAGRFCQSLGYFFGHTPNPVKLILL